jgi:hypothetical protein
MKRHVGAKTAAGLAAAFVLGLIPAASSHAIVSSLSIGVSDHSVRRHQSIFFYGDLKTPGHRGCHRFAEVRLARRHTGLVALTTTDSHGNYVFRIDPKPNHGHYRTRYAGRSSFGYAGSHSCSKAVSRWVRIHRRHR